LAPAGGDAIDRGDDRERQRPQLADQRIVVGLQHAAELRDRVGLRKPIGEVLPGAEGAAGAGEEQRAASRIVLRVGERVAQRPKHGFVEGVEALRAIEGHDPIAVAPFDPDGHFVHGSTLRRLERFHNDRR
jgi:hypothetical protein